MDRPLDAAEIASWAQRPHAKLDDVAPANWLAYGRPKDAGDMTARHAQRVWPRDTYVILQPILPS